MAQDKTAEARTTYSIALELFNLRCPHHLPRWELWRPNKCRNCIADLLDRYASQQVQNARRENAEIVRQHRTGLVNTRSKFIEIKDHGMAELAKIRIETINEVLEAIEAKAKEDK